MPVRRALPLLLTLCWLPAAAGRAQVVLHPNQIVGELRFSNENPEIRAWLDEPFPEGRRRDIEADAADASVDTNADTSVTDDVREGSYELTVESSDEGIAYRVVATSRSAVHPTGGYEFASALSAPVFPEPAGDVRLDFTECAALVRVRFLDDEPGGSVSFPSVHVDIEDPPGSNRWRAQAATNPGTSGPVVTLPVRGTGGRARFSVRWQIRLDDGTPLRLGKTFIAVVRCDEIIELDCRGESDPASLGSIAGEFDVPGVSVRPAPPLTPPRTVVQATHGPWANSRSQILDSDPAVGAFELPSLVASDVVDPPELYTVRVDYLVREGRAANLATSPRTSVAVEAGRVTDLGDHFVMTPSWLDGRWLLLDGPGELPLGSPLEHLRHFDDPDGDGIPDPPTEFEPATTVSSWGLLGPEGEDEAASGRVVSGFEGEFDPDLDGIEGSYGLVLAAPGGRATWWSDPELTLRFRNAGTGPDDLLNATVALGGNLDEGVRLERGGRLELERAACFGRVDLSVSSTDGTFSSPTVTGWRRNEPGDVDFLGQPLVRPVTISAHGVPRWSDPHASEGRVILPLPEGRYVLDTRLLADNPGGGQSDVHLPPVELRLGCGHRLRARPELVTWIEEAPPCGEAGPAVVRAELRGLAEIRSATVRVNEGPEQTLCEPCESVAGVSGTVRLEAGDNAITVTATDELGREATATAFARAAREPSALDLRPDAAPLLLRRDGGELVLDWEGVDGQAALLHAGSLESLVQDRAYDHARLSPCPGESSSARIGLGAGDRYFLLAAECGWGGGSPGRDSFGRPRSRGRGACE